MLALMLATVAYAGAPVQIHVPEGTTAVVLDCAGQRHEAKVEDGVASFSQPLHGCKVSLVKRSGTLPGPGMFRCDESGCELTDVHHAEISNAARRVNIVLTGTYDTKWLEITCPDGYRTRGEIAENTAIFEGVPAAPGCELHFKGATPARYRPIEQGSYRCSLTNTTAVCAQFTP